MRLLLLRHAEAEPAVTSDEARVLTERGIEQASLAGKYCRRNGLRPDLILTSPYERTVQTGDLVASMLDGVPAQTEPFLASGMEPEQGLEGLRSFREFDCLLAVGHQPDLSLLAAALLGLKEPGNIPFGLASLAGLQIDRFAFKGGSLEFFVPLSLMRG
jgi:phosphohistidine phosphatase